MGSIHASPSRCRGRFADARPQLFCAVASTARRGRRRCTSLQCCRAFFQSHRRDEQRPPSNFPGYQVADQRCQLGPKRWVFFACYFHRTPRQRGTGRRKHRGGEARCDGWPAGVAPSRETRPSRELRASPSRDCAEIGPCRHIRTPLKAPCRQFRCWNRSGIPAGRGAPAARPRPPMSLADI